MEVICIDNRERIYKESLNKNNNAPFKKIFLFRYSNSIQSIIDNIIKECDDVSDIVKESIISVITITDINGTNISVDRKIDNNISIPINVYISFKAGQFLGVDFGVDMIACLPIFEDNK